MIAVLPDITEVQQSEDRIVDLIRPQSAFIFTKVRHPAFVSAWGTGKTMCGIARAMRMSEEYPDNLGVIFRKEYTDLRDSTIKDFQDYTKLEVNSQREVVLENGSTIMFRHLEEMNNIQNMNLGWFMIEQAEELDTDDQFFKLWGRLRRAGITHSGFIIANTNGHNWIHNLWKLGNLKGAKLFEATTYDNAKNLPVDFIQSLEIIKTQKPAVFNRFVMNSWDDLDTSDNVIPPEWYDLAVTRPYAPMGEIVLGVDVARFGDDDSVIFPINGHVAMAPISMHGNDTMTVADKVALIADSLHAVKIMVDTIGVGSGVFDRLKQRGYPVYDVNVAEASTVINPKTKKPRFDNLRSEIWWKARESINPTLEFQPAPFILPNLETLRTQLTTPRYTFNGAGQVVVESKKDMKKRLNKSPDIADAYCLAVHGIIGTGQKPWGFFGAMANVNKTQQRASWM